MGLGIGYGLNDEPDTLAWRWKKGLEAPVAQQKVAEAKASAAWVEQAIGSIPALMEKAIARGERHIEVGIFRAGEIPAQRGEFYPERTDLSGGALALYDYCKQQDLHLFVGGDFHVGGGYHKAPFEAIVRLDR